MMWCWLLRAAIVLPRAPLGTSLERLATAVRRLRGQADASQLLLCAGIGSAADGFAALTAEIDRARRYDHPFCLLMLEPDFGESIARLGADSWWSAPTDGRRREPAPALVDLGRLLVQLVRTTDIVAVDPNNGRLMLVLPETDLADIGAPIRRLENGIARTLALPVRWGVAHFPSCALTAEDLVRYALADFEAESFDALPAATQEDSDAEVATA